VDGEGKHSSAHGGSERVSVDRPRSRRVSSSVVYDRGADGASSPLPMAVVAEDSGDLALDELTTAEVKLREHVESFRQTALRDARRIIHSVMPTKLEHLNGIVKARRRGTGRRDWGRRLDRMGSWRLTVDRCTCRAWADQTMEAWTSADISRMAAYVKPPAADAAKAAKATAGEAASDLPPAKRARSESAAVDEDDSDLSSVSSGGAGVIYAQAVPANPVRRRGRRATCADGG